MAAPFSRTMRALAADDARPTVFGIVMATAMLAAWVAWAFLARVPVYVRTTQARLEVDRAVHSVEAPVAGRVISLGFALGDRVAAGQVLVELDTEAERSSRDEQHARLASIDPQVAALRAQAAATEHALADKQQEDHAAIQGAEARAREADSRATIAHEEALRSAGLFAAGSMASAESNRARSEAASRSAAAEGLHHEANRLAWEGRTTEDNLREEIARLRGDIARLEGERGQLTASLQGLDVQIRRRSVVAPVSGRIGQVSEVRMGSYVTEGMTLASIVPDGALRLVGQFPPPTALGRLRRGQTARVRFEGFPWTQFGTLGAVVQSIGTEARGGTVRVEFSVQPDRRSRIPLQHGLLASIEVETERISPASLVLRAAGQALDLDSGGAGASHAQSVE